MATWIKGSRCGVDNCKSRLWRIVDGQKVCRNGHVKAGEYEVGEDEDDYMSQGRRLNISGTQNAPSQSNKNDENEILYGKEANGLFMQCFQLILRKQVEWLIEVQGLRPELAKVVKGLWGLYINDTNFAQTRYHEEGSTEDTDNNVQEVSTTQADEGDSSSEEELEGGYEEDNDEDESDEGILRGRKRKQVRTEPIVVEHVELVHSIALCYLGCVLLRVPVYINDFNRWVYRYEIPYMKSLMLLPHSMRRKLPLYYHSQLTPRGAPTADRLHEEVQKLVHLFKDKHRLEFPAPTWDPLLFKLVRDLLLPPEIWVATRSLLREGGIGYGPRKERWWKPELQSARRLEKRKIPEILCVCAVVVCTKLCFGLDFDEVDREESPHGGSRRGDPSSQYSVPNQTVNWSMWADMLRKLWIEDESLSEADEREVLFWDQAKIDRYLSWFEENFIGTTIEDKMPDMTISQKRMLGLFPTGLYNEHGQVVRKRNNNSDRQRRDSFSVSPLPGTVGEILTFVQSQTEQKTDEELDAVDEDDEPGAKYPSYRTGDNIPVLVDCLYQAAARLGAARVDTIRSVVHHIELTCKKRAKNV